MTSRDPKKGVTVRPEQSRDVEAIRRLNLRAFGEAMGSEAEAELVDTLREQGKFSVSLVDVPDEAFMGLELRPGALSEVSGTVRYQPAFDGI
jgi:predicted N-acetyltransferase YhbS